MPNITAPKDLSPPQQALDHLHDGGLTMGPDWQLAHAICQTREGERACDLVHALCHWIEGDTANASYWYARVAPWQRAATIGAEWQALKATLT